MVRFTPLFCLALLGLSVLSNDRSAAAQSPAADLARPNIVYLLADDLGWGDVGWHNSEIPTPNLDKLASAGARLENFYVQPVCTPTRAALMTGRYPIRHGLQSGVVRPWAQYGLPLDEQTLPQGLKSAGYATAIVGKWHLGHFQREYLPTNRGFDHQYGHYNGAIDYDLHTRDGGFDWHRDDKVSRDEGYSTHLLANEAVRIVQQYAGKQPFFLYVPFNAVHAPHQVPERYLEKFGHLAGERKIYAGMLTALDEAIGQIVDAVDKSGQRNNTLFIFSSDNGGPQPGVVTSNGPLRAGKATHYEGGVRVAALAAWPGKIPEGSVVNEPLHVADWYPTLLKLAGAQVTQRLPLDGLDAWNTIAKGQASPHKDILVNATPYSGAIRAGNWKLVVNGERAAAGFDGQQVPAIEHPNYELFDLAEDPSETKNLAEVNREVLNDLLSRWKKYQAEAIPPRVQPKAKDFKVPAVWGEPDGPATQHASIGIAPSFTTLDDRGQPWKSTEHFGHSYHVVYFYPADFTGGCTKQACAYRDRQTDIQKLGAEIVGISGDSADNHRAFKEAHNLNFTLLADPDGKIAEAFGVPITRQAKQVQAKLNERELLLERNITSKRWTFIIDSTGSIIYKNEQVAAQDDAAQVIKVLESLRQKP